MKKGLWKSLAVMCVVSGMTYAESIVRVSVPSYGKSTKPTFERIVADFEKTNPDIKINLEVDS